MPLTQQGGLTGKKAGLQGIQDVIDRFLAGQEIKRRQTQEDQDRAAQQALRIWQMAQTDPMVLQSPEYKKASQLAGLPVATRAREFEAPKMLAGRDVYSQWNPETGQWGTTDIKTPARAGQNSWGQISQLLTIRKNAQDAMNQDVVDAVDQVLSSIIPPKEPSLEQQTPSSKEQGPGVLKKLSDLLGGLYGRYSASPLGNLSPLAQLDRIARPRIPARTSSPVTASGVTGRSMPAAMQNRFANLNRQSVGMSPIGLTPQNLALANLAPRTGQVAPPTPTRTGQYQVGQIVVGKNGQRGRIVGYDKDGEPLVEPL